MGTVRDTARHEFSSGPAAHAKARHMAQHSRREWLAWTSRDETKHFAQVLTVESLKAALLENGTQGRLVWGFHVGSGTSYWVRWGFGLMTIRKHKMGYAPRSQGGRD